MSIRAFATIAVVAILILVAMAYSGMFMHGD
jgi:hypothetical protein